MYAKLVFVPNTSAVKQVRDITRIIHDSSTGNASLSNLEFIDVGASELIAGVNSGWQAVGKSLPATGTALSTDDSFYYLEGSCVDSSKKKYISIHASFSFTSTALLSNTTDIGLCLSCVVDYGTATEMFTEGYSGINNNVSPVFGIGRDNIIHIFATPRSLILVGQNSNRPVFYGHLEFKENRMTKKHNLPPIAKIVMEPNIPENNTGTTRFVRGDGMYSRTGGCGSFFYFPKSIYDNLRGQVLRILGYIQYNSLNILGQQFSIENGTVNGSHSVFYTDNKYYSADKFSSSFFNPNTAFGWAGANGAPYDNEGKEIDQNGNMRIPIIPLACNINEVGSGLIDFSICNIFKTVGGLGIDGDELILGSDTYYHFTGSTVNSQAGAILIKKE